MPGFRSRRCCWMPELLSWLTFSTTRTHAASGSSKLATAAKKTSNWTFIAWFIATCLEVVWETPMLLLQIMACRFFWGFFFAFLKFFGCLRNTSLLRDKKYDYSDILMEIYQNIMVTMIRREKEQQNKTTLKKKYSSNIKKNWKKSFTDKQMTNSLFFRYLKQKMICTFCGEEVVSHFLKLYVLWFDLSFDQWWLRAELSRHSYLFFILLSSLIRPY